MTLTPEKQVQRLKDVGSSPEEVRQLLEYNTIQEVANVLGFSRGAMVNIMKMLDIPNITHHQRQVNKFERSLREANISHTTLIAWLKQNDYSVLGAINGILKPCGWSKTDSHTVRKLIEETCNIKFTDEMRHKSITKRSNQIHKIALDRLYKAGYKSEQELANYLDRHPQLSLQDCVDMLNERIDKNDVPFAKSWLSKHISPLRKKMPSKKRK